MSYHGLGITIDPSMFLTQESTTSSTPPGTTTYSSGETYLKLATEILPKSLPEGDKALMIEMQTKQQLQPVPIPQTDAPVMIPSGPVPIPQTDAPVMIPSGPVPIPQTDAPVMIPSGVITAQGPSGDAPMPAQPIVDTSKPTGEITNYVPSTGLSPAQPSGPVGPNLDLLSAYCGSMGGQFTGTGCMLAGKLVTSVPAGWSPTAPPIGPIPPGTPPVGPIPEGTPPVGPIPEGTPPVGPIPLQLQQQQAAAAAAAAAAQPAKLPIVPIALAAGAALLLARFMK
jgi:hypothetical protein